MTTRNEDIMKISDVITSLEEIKKNYGDLMVYSVNYHSDFYDVPLLKINSFSFDKKVSEFSSEAFNQFNQIENEEGKSYLLIYGGSR